MLDASSHSLLPLIAFSLTTTNELIPQLHLLPLTRKTRSSERHPSWCRSIQNNQDRLILCHVERGRLYCSSHIRHQLCTPLEGSPRQSPMTDLRVHPTTKPSMACSSRSLPLLATTCSGTDSCRLISVARTRSSDCPGGNGQQRQPGLSTSVVKITSLRTGVQGSRC